MLYLNMYSNSVANKYYFTAGHHEQKNAKITGQIKFTAIKIKQRMKLVLRHFSIVKMNLMYWFKCCRCTVSSTVFSVWSDNRQ